MKQSLTLQILSWKGHYQNEKKKKVISVMKNELGGKVPKEFVGLRQKRIVT